MKVKNGLHIYNITWKQPYTKDDSLYIYIHIKFGNRQK